MRNERRLRLLYGESIDELWALTKEQVIDKHDAHVEEARSSNKQGVRLQWLERAQAYRDELARREPERQGERMEALTRSMYVLSGVGVAVAIVGVVLSLLRLLSGA